MSSALLPVSVFSPTHDHSIPLTYRRSFFMGVYLIFLDRIKTWTMPVTIAHGLGTASQGRLVSWEVRIDCDILLTVSKYWNPKGVCDRIWRGFCLTQGYNDLNWINKQGYFNFQILASNFIILKPNWFLTEHNVLGKTECLSTIQSSVQNRKYFIKQKKKKKI